MRFVLPWLRYGLPGEVPKNRSAPLYAVTGRSKGFPDELVGYGEDTSLYGALPEDARRHRSPNHASAARPHFIARLLPTQAAPAIAVSQYFALPEFVGQSASRPTVDALTFLIDAETLAASMVAGVSIDDWAVAVARAVARPENAARPTLRARWLASDDLVIEDVFNRTAAENASLAIGALAASRGVAGDEGPFAALPDQLGPAAFLVTAFRALLARAGGGAVKSLKANAGLAAYGSWPTDPAFIVQSGQGRPLRVDGAHQAASARSDAPPPLAPDLPATAHWARALRLLIDADALADVAERAGGSEYAPTPNASERILIGRLAAAAPDFRSGLPASIAAVTDALSVIGGAPESPVAVGAARVVDRLVRLGSVLADVRRREAAA